MDSPVLKTGGGARTGANYNRGGEGSFGTSLGDVTLHYTSLSKGSTAPLYPRQKCVFPTFQPLSSFSPSVYAIGKSRARLIFRLLSKAGAPFIPLV